MKTLPRLLVGLAVAAAATQAFAQVRVFEHDNFRGRSFTAERAIADFSRFGFNDKASSVIVRSGTWELCDDGGFRGRCVVLRPGRYPSLAAMGMNDRVSSLRRAGPRRR
ncbi:MAG: beta/gamma crystallin family protein [Caldimonas sp.]